MDVAGLESLGNLETLDLTGNTDILCSDLDALEAALPSTTITRPPSCDTSFLCAPRRLVLGLDLVRKELQSP